VDIQDRWEPDICADFTKGLDLEDGCADIAVLHHVLEHFGCGEAESGLEECYRVLRPGGSLLVFVPDLRRLAQRWMAGMLDTQLFLTQLYGAYMGDEADRHKWGFDREHLLRELMVRPWRQVKGFDWRTIEGADLARDWYILAMEAVK
jgi:predicted SAM-dependent methyltransferase